MAVQSADVPGAKVQDYFRIWPPLSNLSRSGHVEGVVDQGLDAFQKPHRVWEAAVIVERRFVSPTGMNVEQSRIPDRSEDMDAQAAGLLSRWFDNLTKGVGDVILLTGMSVEPCKDEKLHCKRTSRTIRKPEHVSMLNEATE